MKWAKVTKVFILPDKNFILSLIHSSCFLHHSIESMPRKKRGLLQKQKHEESILTADESTETKAPENLSVEDLAAWRKSHLMYDELTPDEQRETDEEAYWGPTGMGGDLGVKNKAEFDAYIRSNMPDLDKRIKNVMHKHKATPTFDRSEFERVQRETGYRPMKQIGPGDYVHEPSRMKYMIVVYKAPYIVYNCAALGCTRSIEYRAFVLADIKANRDRAKDGCSIDEWRLPDDTSYPVQDHSHNQLCGPFSLRKNPASLRSEILDLCPYHRHNSNIMDCFPTFRKHKHLKRIIEVSI